jgi:hypothetical protein
LIFLFVTKYVFLYLLQSTSSFVPLTAHPAGIYLISYFHFIWQLQTALCTCSPIIWRTHDSPSLVIFLIKVTKIECYFRYVVENKFLIKIHLEAINWCENVEKYTFKHLTINSAVIVMEMINKGG